jgi:hypothetical protein
MVAAGFSLGMVIFIYLRPPGAAGQIISSCGDRIKPWLERHHLDLKTAKLHFVPVLSGMFKILLSYCQCIGAITRFAQVRWPVVFTDFLEGLMELLPELLTILPAECVTGSRLGFSVELISTMMMPLILVFYVYLVVLVVRLLTLCSRNHHPSSAGIFADEHGRDPWRVRYALQQGREKVDVPQDLMQRYAERSLGASFRLSLRLGCTHPKLLNVFIFGMLWLYPMLCRKSVATFDCVRAGVTANGRRISLLRDDPVVECYTAEWVPLAALAGAGLVVFALGVPYGAFILARDHRRDTLRKEREERQRLEMRSVSRVSRKKQDKGSAFLARLYKPHFWYVEPISLLHNFFFTGVVHIIEPESRLQVWAGWSSTLRISWRGRTSTLFALRSNRRRCSRSCSRTSRHSSSFVTRRSTTRS